MPSRSSHASENRSAAAAVHLSKTMPRWLAMIEERPLTTIAVLAAAMLLPFVAKPFHVDDPMYVWAAEHILKQPLDFYGFRVHWTGHELPMHQAMQNPPLASYWAALAALIGGMREVTLHLAFFVPGLLTAIGTWRLARGFCGSPALAAVIAVVTPVFALSGTTIMADMILLCCWVWAVHLWDQGLRNGRWRDIAGAATLAGLAMLAKYPGINLLPLLAAYALLRRAPLRYLAALVIPVAVIVAYELITKRLYGVGLFTEAMTYARHVREIRDAEPIRKVFIALCFTGACFAPVLLLGPWLWTRRGLIGGAAIFGLTTVALIMIDPGHFPQIVANDANNLPLICQMALWFAVGVGIVALCALDLHQHRDAASMLLVLWVLGTVAFAGVVNWSVNGRTLLPMLPAVAILIVRRMEMRAMLQAPNAQWLPAALGAAAVLTTLVTLADASLARASRRAAIVIADQFQSPNRTLWFQGHWGFQHYMQRESARPLVIGHSVFDAGDIVATPLFGPNIRIIGEPLWSNVELHEEPALRWLSTLNPAVGAGFYSDAAGPLPFVFGSIPPERFIIQRINVPYGLESSRRKKTSRQILLLTE